MIDPASAGGQARVADAWRRRASRYGLALLIFAIDRGVKVLLTGPAGLELVGSIRVLPVFALTYAANFGVSYGWLTATSEEMRWILIAMTGLIALAVAAWLMVERRRADGIGLALVLGGALGNIYDRFVHGFVIDYAELHIGEWHPFGIFNLADLAITGGVLILLARSLLSGEKPAKAGPETLTENP